MQTFRSGLQQYIQSFEDIPEPVGLAIYIPYDSELDNGQLRYSGYLGSRIPSEINKARLLPSTQCYTIPTYHILIIGPVVHTVLEKTKLLGRVRRIRGQIEALERSLEAGKSCSEILHLIAAARGAMNGLMTKVIEDHIQEHIANPAIASDAERNKGADELIDVIRTYLK